MLSVSHTARLIGNCLGCALLFGGGAYLAWVWPGRVRREAQTNDISEQKGREKLRQFSPLLGYLVMALAALFAISQFL